MHHQPYILHPARQPVSQPLQTATTKQDTQPTQRPEVTHGKEDNARQIDQQSHAYPQGRSGLGHDLTLRLHIGQQEELLQREHRLVDRSGTIHTDLHQRQYGREHQQPQQSKAVEAMKRVAAHQQLIEQVEYRQAGSRLEYIN